MQKNILVKLTQQRNGDVEDTKEYFGRVDM